MENIECGHMPLVRRKEKKKKPAKDDLDRIKQAEKKKRRLEKALATSAAIRSELEKKKQKKIEEQRQLDEEGARLAEAVALRVLCDDADDSCQLMLNKNHGLNLDRRDYMSNISLLTGGWRTGSAYQAYAKYPIENMSLASNIHGSRSRWNEYGIGWPLSSGMARIDFRVPYIGEKSGGSEISAGLIAAQAVSSLHIAEDICNEINLYREA